MADRTHDVNGEAVGRYRTAKGWTQEDLAAKAGMSATTIRKLEKGGPAFLPTIRDVAEALGCKVIDLLPQGKAEPVEQPLQPGVELLVTVTISKERKDLDEVTELPKLYEILEYVLKGKGYRIMSIQNKGTQLTFAVPRQPWADEVVGVPYIGEPIEEVMEQFGVVIIESEDVVTRQKVVLYRRKVDTTSEPQ